MLAGYKDMVYLPIRNWFAATTFISPREPDAKLKNL